MQKQKKKLFHTQFRESVIYFVNDDFRFEFNAGHSFIHNKKKKLLLNLPIIENGKWNFLLFAEEMWKLNAIMAKIEFVEMTSIPFTKILF